ncbi:MAG TPA: glycosyltransferase [Bryobacteraceae bacterium]|nr:glycosyltransferase [Bryobacteraceae bacterium]HOL72842.1 glycosyltransferase [Bryobacteraceae bacterium]HOQ46396.1 glycosyltransferase [Bryobacteraceae bacterium]HPQ15091.1 glycosyltransferase [Bryobacteraceae bacterium]HPU72167.1 glycosyltransferase [Bryobacteraceae bacterium]
MKKLDFLFFDAGGGHRSSANALKLAIERDGRPWEVRLVNLQELLDPLDVFRKLTGLRLQDVYNLMLKKGWTLGSSQLVRPMQLLIRLYHRKQVELLERHWRESRPDMVVSFIPHFNRAIAESRTRAIPGVPFVTIILDIADYPPHFWIERESEYIICGSERAVEQARASGHSDDRIFRTSGVILHPRFYEPVQVDRRAERMRLGLDPDRPTGLVLFGGQGNRVMLDIAKRLDASGLDLQLIFICGRNEKLRERLRAAKLKLPRFVEGFTTEIPYYMHLSDFFIGKPGPGSISEALAMKLPVIVERNAWTLPQERYNTEWVTERGVGLVVPSFRRIAEAVGWMLEPEAFRRFRERAAAVHNRAVFEIPDNLASIFERHGIR